MAPRIILGDWQACREQALALRFQVFVHEQGVPPEMEEDEWDPLCLHALALDENGQLLGTGRLLPDGHIGRMAVAKQARGQGVGSAILLSLLARARENGHMSAVLNAQLQAAGFYQRHGFLPSSQVFDDAGLPHIEMRLFLTS